jgi:trigger factor
MSDLKTIEIELSEAGGCRRRLAVTIPAEEVSREFDHAAKTFAKSARIPGFRKGHVPPALIRKRFAREIEDEVRDHLVRHGLSEAFERHKLHPLHDPVVEGEAVREGESYAYSALFEVRPEVRLDRYTGLPVTMSVPEVTDDDVDKAIASLRENLARFVPVPPRPAARGDFLLLDLEGHYEDGKGSDFKHESVMVEIGSETNLPEFNETLPGMSPGETRQFVVAYPQEFGAEQLAGRRVGYTAALKEIKARELPPADDELPKDLGKSGTLADLREEVRRDLGAARRRTAERQARESLLRQLIEATPLDLPEIMVEDQLNLQIEEIVRSMIVRGIHPAKAEVDWKEIREKEFPLARQRVQGMLILDAVAAREGLEVTDAEVARRIAEESARSPRKGEEVRKRLEEASTRQVVKNQLLREKSLDFLLKNATITS